MAPLPEALVHGDVCQNDLQSRENAKTPPQADDRTEKEKRIRAEITRLETELREVLLRPMLSAIPSTKERLDLLVNEQDGQAGGDVVQELIDQITEQAVATGGMHEGDRMAVEEYIASLKEEKVRRRKRGRAGEGPKVPTTTAPPALEAALASQCQLGGVKLVLAVYDLAKSIEPPPADNELAQSRLLSEASSPLKEFTGACHRMITHLFPPTEQDQDQIHLGWGHHNRIREKIYLDAARKTESKLLERVNPLYADEQMVDQQPEGSVVTMREASPVPTEDQSDRQKKRQKVADWGVWMVNRLQDDADGKPPWSTDDFLEKVASVQAAWRDREITDEEVYDQIMQVLSNSSQAAAAKQHLQQQGVLISYDKPVQKGGSNDPAPNEQDMVQYLTSINFAFAVRRSLLASVSKLALAFRYFLKSDSWGLSEEETNVLSVVASGVQDLVDILETDLLTDILRRRHARVDATEEGWSDLQWVSPEFTCDYDALRFASDEVNSVPEIGLAVFLQKLSRAVALPDFLDMSGTGFTAAEAAAEQSRAPQNIFLIASLLAEFKPVVNANVFSGLTVLLTNDQVGVYDAETAPVATVWTSAAAKRRSELARSRRAARTAQTQVRSASQAREQAQKQHTAQSQREQDEQDLRRHQTQSRQAAASRKREATEAASDAKDVAVGTAVLIGRRAMEAAGEAAVGAAEAQALAQAQPTAALAKSDTRELDSPSGSVSEEPTPTRYSDITVPYTSDHGEDEPSPEPAASARLDDEPLKGGKRRTRAKKRRGSPRRKPKRKTQNHKKKKARSRRRTRNRRHVRTLKHRRRARSPKVPR